jgi:hypothetical protein
MIMRRYAVVARLMVFMAAALVSACGGGGGDAVSAGGGASAPATPAGVIALCGNMKITVSWTAVAGATSYNIYRSTTSGVAGTLLGTVATTSYVDTTGTLGTTYHYTVAAINSAGTSAASLEASDAFYTLQGGGLQTGAFPGVYGQCHDFCGFERV